MAKITSEMVAAAAEKLQAGGHKITQTSVRNELGGGSLSTINPLLRAWKDQQIERRSFAEVEVPDNVQERASEFLGLIWNTALSEASIVHDALRNEIKSLYSQEEDRDFEYGEALKSVESELSDSRSKLDEISAVVAAKDTEIAILIKRAVVAEQNQAVALERAKADAERADRADVSASKAEARADRAEILSDKAEVRVEELQDKLDALSYMET